MSELEPLFWETGIGDSPMYTAAHFDGNRLYYVIQALKEKYAKSLADGTLTPDDLAKAKFIELSEINAVAISSETCNMRIEYASGKKLSIAARKGDYQKLVRIHDELKARLAPDAPVEQSQATLSEAIGVPVGMLFLIGVFSGAIYWLILLDDGKPGRKGVAKLLFWIGYNNVLIAMGVLAGLVILLGVALAIFRPKMDIFYVRKPA